MNTTTLLLSITIPILLLMFVVAITIFNILVLLHPDKKVHEEEYLSELDRIKLGEHLD